MRSSKTKTGLSETLPNKTTPASPRVSRIAKGPARSDSNLSSPLQNSRLSIDRSPRSVDSKSSFERRSPKISTPPDKTHRPSKPSELQAQLGVVQDDLKKAKECLASAEKEKAQAIEELKEAKKFADEANEKLSEALVAQKRAEESSEIEKFRADELEQAGIEASQKREEEWQNELDAVRNQHAVDVAALLSATQELQRVKHELSMTTEAKNAALNHADDAMKIAEINAEKAEVLSGEVSRLKASLESMLETKANEAAELVKKLHSEIDLLKEELERAKGAEERLAEMEALIEGFKVQVNDSKAAASDANTLVEELKKKVELLEIQIEEATQSERSASESLASLKQQLDANNASLQDAEAEIASLRENAETLEISLGRHKVDLEESNCHLEMAKREAMEMERTVENLKYELQSVKDDKAQAQNNEMLALSSVQSLLDEKNKLIEELEASRDEEEKSKNAMESLASALHEVSMEARDAKEKLATNEAELGNAESQIEELKSVLKATKDKYEPMLDKLKEEMDRLEEVAEKSQIEAKSSKDKLDQKELDFMVAIKKSEEELEMAKREMDMVAENSKAEWHEKELGFMASIKESEQEITALKVQLDRLLNLLKETEEEAQVAKEDGDQLRNTLKQAESEANSAKEAAEKAKAESLLLKERLLEKESELQRTNQENDDLRTREAAAFEKVEEYSKLLAEASANKTEFNGELSNSEKSYDLLPKMMGSSEETVTESEAAEKSKAESLLLKEKLLEKESELQRTTQENDDLRTREAAALEKVEEYSKLLAEASVKKTEEIGELSNSEKSYDLLPKMVGFSEENVNGSDEEKPKAELPLEQIKENGGGDLLWKADVVEVEPERMNGNGNAKEVEDNSDDVEAKMWDSCKVADKDLSPEREAGPESVEDETDSKIDGDNFDHVNGLSSETMDNGRSSPTKQHHKKKKPLLRKFGNLLKKKSSPK